MKFSIKGFFSKCDKIRGFCHILSQFPADLVTFTEEIFNGKLHFLCSVTTIHLKKPLILCTVRLWICAKPNILLYKEFMDTLFNRGSARIVLFRLDSVKKMSFSPLFRGFLITGTTASIKSLGTKNFICIFYFNYV